MINLKKLFIAIIFIILADYIVVGANLTYSFKHYNTNNGLSQNTVRTIMQDNLGFMWFGTKDGLNRFDGTSFKLFKFSPNGDLSYNVIHRILQDNNSKIWVSTENGVYIYDQFKEQFDHFDRKTSENDIVRGVVSEMIEDSNGDIWMSVEGKGVFNYKITEDLLNFYSIPIVEDGMKMVSLYPDNDKGVWVLPYSSEIIHIDKNKKEITQLNLEDDPELLFQTGEVLDVYSDHNNILLLATSQKGLVAINTINKTHKILLDKDSNGEPLFIRTIEKVAPSTLWIGTESGIYIYNSNTYDIINLRHNPANPTSLSDNAIYSIYKDRDGGIWIGSYFGGVDYYTDINNNFELFYPVLNEQSINGKRVREFCNAPDGNIWIGTEDGGLNLFDPDNNKFLPLPIPLRSLYTNIHALLQDGDNLWISTYSKGLNKYNVVTEELVVYTNSDDPYSISHNSTFTLCKDRQGLLWIGTLSGVNIYDEEKDHFTHIEKFKGMSIEDIFEDSKGYIWVSTFMRGVHRFDPSTGNWKIFQHNSSDSGSLPYNKPTSMFEDTEGRLWVTTQGGGFGMFDYVTETFLTYNTSKGLHNDVVYQIVDDNELKLWLSTNQGLVRFDPEKELFENFTVDNGLKTNQFNYKSSFKGSSGNIYFGSIDGFIRINPSIFLSNDIVREPLFTDLFVNNQRSIPSEHNSILKQSIMFTDEIKLPHNQNSISLNYALLDYSGLSKNNIYYKLEGVDKDWVKSTDGQPLNYSNLKPGKYNLLLGIRGYENTSPITNKTLSIIISSPYWLTGWAYTLYFLLFITVIFLLLRFLRIRARLKHRNSMIEFEQQKERELYQSKIKFFTNVAHEIRSPLTLIKAPLDHVLTTEIVSDSVKDNLQIMSKNTDRLLNLTNQLLDFRKTESEAYLLNVQTQNVSNLIRETIIRFTPLAKQKKILLQSELSDQDMFIQIDKEAFLKIISNLLNNALKYCDHYVRLEAVIKENKKKEFCLLIENDGELIPPKYKHDIFKLFVHIDGDQEKKVSGTGIGLALASSLAELHSGSLSLENDDNYNRFLLKLPGDLAENENKQITELDRSEIWIDNGSGTQLKDATLLLVDDDLELLQFEANFLSAHYQLVIAENGVEAMEQLKKTNVNLVVTDVMMPEMDGFEFTQRVKSDVEFSHIPVILLTAKSMTQSKVHGYELGADAYLEKPFSVEVLLARIQNLLHSRNQLRESFMKNPFIGATTVALTKSDEEFIIKLNILLQENLSESDFNVENMAEHFNMSRASFYRKVKGVLDLTPNEYLKVERLKKAAMLLKERDNKVNEVCFLVGFNSPSYFAKCFQQQFGILPKDFQELR